MVWPVIIWQFLNFNRTVVIFIQDFIQIIKLINNSSCPEFPDN